MRLSSAAIAILLVCSVALASSMALGYTVFLEEDIPVQDTSEPAENTQPSESVEQPTEDYSDMPSNADDYVVVSEYRATSNSEVAARTENIRLAAEAINGRVIKPGETFSFNETVGDTEIDERYQLAPVVTEEGMVYGRGGGCCQVSSALYIAALSAGLTITERHPHATVVDYVPIGLDATVVYGVMDLKITNDTEHAMTITAIAEGQSVTVQLSGKPLAEGVVIEPISTLIEYHEAGTPVAYTTERGSELENITYYVVDSYREYYYHGSKTETVFLARDSYRVFADSTVRMPNGGTASTK